MSDDYLVNIASAISRHASENYNTDGWDYIVECYSLNDIIAVLIEEQITNLDAALKHFAWRASLLNDRRRDIQGTVF